MKCPFCAEDDLKDEATVCKHCGRDLGVYQSFAVRIASLEHRVGELTTELETRRLDLANRPRPFQKAVSSWPIAWRISAAVLICGVATGFTFPLLVLDILSELSLFTSYTYLLISASLTIGPGILGLWIGLRFPELRRWLYLVTGMAYVLVMNGTLRFLRSYKYGEAAPWLDTPRWDPGWAMFGLQTDEDVFLGFLAPTLAVVGGGLLARAIWGTSLGSGFAQRLAGRVVRRHSMAANALQQQDRVKRLAAFFSAIAPLLTFTAAIITAYFASQGKK
jgi:hypothetical protein